ncbi:MAG: DEAD/DEAH box helicase, partial [Vicinamibacterales bacterium]
LEHFGVFEPETTRLLVGFTATPRRGDRRGLGEIFEEIDYSRGLMEMIGDGYLSRVAGWRVRTEIDLDKVHVRHGEFVEEDLGRAVDVAERNNLLLRAYRELAAGRRCLVFCVDVQHAKDVADVFRKGGLRVEAIWGEMPKQDRKEALRKFKNGQLEILTNCNVLTEGFDEPRVDCVLMARPTKSLLLYAQMLGRGTRIHPEKRNLLVIDVVDNTTQHTLAGLHMLFDLPTNLSLRGSDALVATHRLREISRRFPWVDLHGAASDKTIRADELVDAMKFVAERVDLFRFEPPDEIAAFTEFTWIGSAGGGFRLNLNEGRHLLVQANLLDKWEVRYRSAISASDDVLIADASDPSGAIAAADAFVREKHPDDLRLVSRDAEWRGRAPSEKQIEFLQRWQFPIPKGLTRGQASWMITHASSRNR